MRDATGNNAYAPQPSTDLWNATLTNGAASGITIPSNYENWVISISYQPGSDVWVDFTGAAAIVPIGGTFASTTSELLPGPRTVKAGSTVSLITDNTTADVGISLYAVTYP